MTREEWLIKASEELTRTVLKNQKLPKYRVSCGFPHKKAFSVKQRALGECWGSEVSNDTHYEIFISPVLAEANAVLGVLVHEMIHAIVGTKAGHGPVFKKLAKAIGLEGKMAATVPSPDLAISLRAIADTLGKYPHAEIVVIKTTKPKKSSVIKLLCTCGYLLRTSKTWLERGLPTCCCGQIFRKEDNETVS